MSVITKYYDYKKLFSYNGTYNFVIGGRGLGKTYGAQKKVITDAINTGIKNGFDKCDQFIYLRRYKEEMQISRDTFFAAIGHEFPEWDFKVDGYKAQISPVGDRNIKRRVWMTIGYFINLSTGQKHKSTAFPRVKTIIFDEFIIEKGMTRYLPDEAVAFNNFYSTIDRYKDKTRVLFLANSVLMNNPYFTYYKIDPLKVDKNGLVRLKKNELSGRHFIIAHFPDSKEFQSEVYQTEFGRFIAGTEYAEYAVGNQFSDAHNDLIAQKTARSRYLYTLEGPGGTLTVWYDMGVDTYYLLQKKPRGNEKIYTILPERMNENKTLISKNDRRLTRLWSAYSHARTAFDIPQTRNAFLEIY